MGRERWREEEEKPRQAREEVRSRQGGRREKWGRSEAGKESKGTEGIGEGPPDTEEAASPLFAGLMTTTMRFKAN